MSAVKLEPGQVWFDVKHSPFRGFLGAAASDFPERIDVLLIERHPGEHPDPLWRVRNLPDGAAVPGSRFEYWELESAILTGFLIP